MLSLLAAMAIQGQQAQTPVAPAGPTASGLIGQMFKRYADARTVSGRIRMVQTAMNTSYQVDTNLSLERPDLICLDQRDSRGSAPATLVSDGVRFVYSANVGTKKNPMRMMESMNPDPKHHLHIADMYPCVFSALTDRSPTLDIAVGRTTDLKVLVQHLQSFSLKGTAAVLGRTAYDISGIWADNPTVHQQSSSEGMEPSGTFDLYISPDGDFVRLEVSEVFAVSAQWLTQHHLPQKAYPNGVSVTSTWDADLKVDQPLDHQQFAIKQG